MDPNYQSWTASRQAATEQRQCCALHEEQSQAQSQQPNPVSGFRQTLQGSLMTSCLSCRPWPAVMLSQAWRPACVWPARQHTSSSCIQGRRTCFDGANEDEGGESHVELGGQVPREDAGQAVDGQQVYDEGVATPRCHLGSQASVQLIGCNMLLARMGALSCTTGSCSAALTRERAAAH